MKIAVLFIGTVEDGGFNQCALDGVLRLRDHAGARIEVVRGIPYHPGAMTEALHDVAVRSDGIVFIGGQGNVVTPPVATAHPDRAFAIVQGNATGPNLASYDVLQEQSAFLAGVLAARMTRTGVVGHLSGHRVVPGLKGRAAFASGVHHADARVRIVSGFCGTQDDSSVTKAWANAIAREGADHLFTMLNAARDGATAACHDSGMRQIGNVTDWCRADPEVFVASAVARIDLGVEQAILDMLSGIRPPEVQHLGLAQHAAELTFSPDVPQGVRDDIADLALQIAAGHVDVETDYSGPEFEIAT